MQATANGWVQRVLPIARAGTVSETSGLTPLPPHFYVMHVTRAQLLMKPGSGSFRQLSRKVTQTIRGVVPSELWAQYGEKPDLGIGGKGLRQNVQGFLPRLPSFVLRPRRR